MDVALPVAIQPMVIRQQGLTIYYPAIVGLANKQVEIRINQTIFRQVESLMRQQYEQQGTSNFTEVVGTFEVKTNERHILSLSLTNYSYAAYHANGLTLMNSLTFDVQTGKVYNLADLFKQDSHYVQELSSIVKRQLKLRDIPTLEEFTSISPNQEFYLADKSLVLYFQELEITAHYIGIPMFPISVYEIENIIDENGPLGRLAASI